MSLCKAFWGSASTVTAQELQIPAHVESRLFTNIASEFHNDTRISIRERGDKPFQCKALASVGETTHASSLKSAMILIGNIVMAPSKCYRRRIALRHPRVPTRVMTMTAIVNWYHTSSPLLRSSFLSAQTFDYTCQVLTARCHGRIIKFQ